MKKFFHIALTLCAAGALMCSCEPEPKADGVAEIKSFAITAAANEALSQDCAAIIDQTASTIVVALPMDTDKSALVPTFTTTDGDVVTVAGAEVKSGQSALDLTESVEVVVTDASSNVTKTYALSAADNDGKAELLSVGFLAKDNAGKLTEDAVAEAIADEMVVRIAGGGAGVELVMSFTAGLNDVVTVNNEEAVATATVDCTFPIDITVSDPYAGVEKSYVVKVGKILQNAGWTEMASIEIEGASADFYFAVDKVKDVPYIAYMGTVGEGETAVKNCATVLKWNGTAFERLGSENIANGAVAWVGVAAHDGKVYTFMSENNTNVTTAKTPSMFAFDGSAWSALGTRGFSEKAGSNYAVAVNPTNGYPIGVYMCDNRNSTSVPRRGAMYCAWTGTDWDTNKTIPVATHDQSWYCYSPRFATHNDVVYLSVHLQNRKTIVIYKLEKGIWSVVQDEFIPEGAANMHASNSSIAVAANGDVYFEIAEDSKTNGSYVPQVFKHTANGMVKVCSSIDRPLGSGGYNSVALTTDTNNNPVIAYHNQADNYCYVVSVDTESNDWGEPFVVNKKNDSTTPLVYMDNADNGTMYLAVAEGVKETVSEEVDGEVKETVKTKYRYLVYKNALEADVLPE